MEEEEDRSDRFIGGGARAEWEVGAEDLLGQGRETQGLIDEEKVAHKEEE